MAKFTKYLQNTTRNTFQLSYNLTNNMEVFLLLDYKIQFINAYTQELLREQIMETEHAEILIKSLVTPKHPKLKDEPAYILDSQYRLLKADFVTHTSFIEDGINVYRLFFKVKLNEKQIPIKR